MIKTGRRDSRGSYLGDVETLIPNHNDSLSSVISTFNSIGIDVEATVALLGTIFYLVIGFGIDSVRR